MRRSPLVVRFYGVGILLLMVAIGTEATVLASRTAQIAFPALVVLYLFRDGKVFR